MYATLENLFERLLEPLVLDVSDLRIDIDDDEVQDDLVFGREDEDVSEAAAVRPEGAAA